MQPGEITLAHLGVLLMDEFPEFHNDVIQSLRTPIEKKMIHISRREGQVVFPADFLLLATANPCPCGNLGDEKRHCICSINDIMRYRKKLSGPIIDRIDLQIFVPRLNFTDISGQHNNAHSIQSSQKVFEKVISARERQKIRFKDQIFKTNANMNIAFIEKYVPLNRALKILMKDFMNKWLLSSRAYHSLLRISRTIADLSDVSDVKEEHLYEAFQYRSLDIENYDFIRKYHLN